MSKLDHLFEKNAEWAENIKAEDPDFFTKLSEQQTPEYLWIGCSDSRVPANQIVGLLPGDVFVHRNIANLVIHTDLSCLSVMQFAVEVLKVKHIMVTGHYGCGGVKAAMDNQQVGIVDYWIRNIRDVYYNNQEELEHIDDEEQRLERLVELNVMQQVANVSHNNIVQNAWLRGQELTIHGWCYSIKDGIIRNLMEPIDSPDDISERYRLT
ncbi:carbonate dehydratase [Gilvimarinus agarilyticus]|uniref:carbonate dehydratase n=1 Tax=unclassified Gilvimarinus TaxID=2642066 RepID=UPI001C0833FD|nr:MULTISPECIES: carbonate dehydratase [unclassified Gilvimarinus]MBU2886904.1 carbonate dehydratase [Gilvimarinus agarilyticus]MDO6571565.1 carbonate dehydratase [Gilvimarinus sp. 2_MG-2023]MDO6747912.1 carbonate dehydratase [Gilvimarinus sp. 1_MG-2023]